MYSLKFVFVIDESCIVHTKYHYCWRYRGLQFSAIWLIDCYVHCIFLNNFEKLSDTIHIVYHLCVIETVARVGLLQIIFSRCCCFDFSHIIKHRFRLKINIKNIFFIQILCCKKKVATNLMSFGFFIHNLFFFITWQDIPTIHQPWTTQNMPVMRHWPDRSSFDRLRSVEL